MSNWPRSSLAGAKTLKAAFLNITYDFLLTLTSIAVAVLASYTALHLASCVSVARSKASSLAWLGGGALSMGIGIWSMHFVGMLGSSIGIAMVYDLGWTLLSLAISVLVSGLALWLVRRENLSWLNLISGGVVMGGGIACMHYAGMMALQISPAIRFEPVMVAVSTLIAVLVSITALSLFVALRSTTLKHRVIKRGAGALVMGVAIAGMHYAGMASASFSPGSICTAPEGEVSNLWLAGLIAGFTFLVLTMALITALYDAHLLSRDALNQELFQESRQLERANRQIRQQSTDLAILNLQLENRVVQRTEQLEESVRELKAFSHAVAHDLRGPITTGAGFCGLLAKSEAGRLSDKGCYYLEKIKVNLKNMADLIDGLLSLTHLSQIDLKHEQINLSCLARDVLDDWHLQEPKRRVSSSVQGEMHCMGDVRLIKQVMINLIGNAWKFSSKQPTAVIHVGMQIGPNEQVVFFVSDNGAGFDMAYVNKLFGTFQRLHSHADFEGTGIGLATVRRIIVRHGGRIWASSILGEGATFFFTLSGLADTRTNQGEPRRVEAVRVDRSLSNITGKVRATLLQP